MPTEITLDYMHEVASKIVPDVKARGGFYIGGKWISPQRFTAWTLWLLFTDLDELLGTEAIRAAQDAIADEAYVSRWNFMAVLAVLCEVYGDDVKKLVLRHSQVQIK
jgi:hypothetical protein